TGFRSVRSVLGRGPSPPPTGNTGGMAVVLALVLALAAPSNAGTTARPALRVVDDMPLVIRGTGVKPRGTGQVSRAPPARSRATRVVASFSGTSTVRFSLAPIQCQMVESVVATGNRGSRARAQPALPDCVKPPPPA